MQNTKLIEVGDYNGDAVYINTSNITQVMNYEIDTYIYTKICFTDGTEFITSDEINEVIDLINGVGISTHACKNAKKVASGKVCKYCLKNMRVAEKDLHSNWRSMDNFPEYETLDKYADSLLESGDHGLNKASEVKLKIEAIIETNLEDYLIDLYKQINIAVGNVEKCLNIEVRDYLEDSVKKILVGLGYTLDKMPSNKELYVNYKISW